MEKLFGSARYNELMHDRHQYEMNPIKLFGQEGYIERRAISGKRLLDFIRAHPEGVTRNDIAAAGISFWGMDQLLELNVVIGSQVREPERGPRCYHWLWKLNINESEG